MRFDFFLLFFFFLFLPTTHGGCTVTSTAAPAPCSSASLPPLRAPLDSAGMRRESGLPPKPLNLREQSCASDFSCPRALLTPHPLLIDDVTVWSLRAAMASFDAEDLELVWPAADVPCLSVSSFPSLLSRAHHERMPPVLTAVGAYIERDVLSAWWGRLGWLSETPMSKLQSGGTKREPARAPSVARSLHSLCPLPLPFPLPSLPFPTFPGPGGAAEGQLLGSRACCAWWLCRRLGLPRGS